MARWAGNSRRISTSAPSHRKLFPNRIAIFSILKDTVVVSKGRVNIGSRNQRPCRDSPKARHWVGRGCAEQAATLFNEPDAIEPAATPYKSFGIKDGSIDARECCRNALTSTSGYAREGHVALHVICHS